ncbi:hypothetical protein ACWIGM_20750 [Bosea sp. NPDC055332]
MTGLVDLQTLLALRRRREQRAGERAARQRAAAASAGAAANEAAGAIAAHDEQSLSSQRARHRGLLAQPFSLTALARFHEEAMIAGAARHDLEAAAASAADTLSARQRDLAASQAVHRERRHDRIRLEQACDEQAKRERKRQQARLDAALDEAASGRPAR